MPLVNALASDAGRVLRLFSGGALVAAAAGMPDHASGQLVAAVALLPMLEALCDVVLLGPVFGAPLDGAAIRRERREQQSKQMHDTHPPEVW